MFKFRGRNSKIWKYSFDSIKIKSNIELSEENLIKIKAIVEEAYGWGWSTSSNVEYDISREIVHQLKSIGSAYTKSKIRYVLIKISDNPRKYG